MNRRKVRKKLELRAMEYLNELNDNDGIRIVKSYFDCGKDGTLYIFWLEPCWHTEWIYIQPFPGGK